MSGKAKKMDKKNMKLVGYYKADEVDKINDDIEKAKSQHQKNLDDGFKVVGSFNKDTPIEDVARIMAKASIYGSGEPTEDEVQDWIKRLEAQNERLAKRAEESEKRRIKREAKKAEKERVKELLAKENITYKDFVEGEDHEPRVHRILEEIYSGKIPDGEVEAVCKYIERELKDARLRKGQRERRKQRLAEQEK